MSLSYVSLVPCILHHWTLLQSKYPSDSCSIKVAPEHGYLPCRHSEEADVRCPVADKPLDVDEAAAGRGFCGPAY